MAKGSAKKSFLDLFKITDSNDDDFDDDMFDDEDEMEDEYDDPYDEAYDSEEEYDDGSSKHAIAKIIPFCVVSF